MADRFGIGYKRCTGKCRKYSIYLFNVWFWLKNDFIILLLVFLFQFCLSIRLPHIQIMLRKFFLTEKSRSRLKSFGGDSSAAYADHELHVLIILININIQNVLENTKIDRNTAVNWLWSTYSSSCLLWKIDDHLFARLS